MALVLQDGNKLTAGDIPKLHLADSFNFEVFHDVVGVRVWLRTMLVAWLIFR